MLVAVPMDVVDKLQEDSFSKPLVSETWLMGALGCAAVLALLIYVKDIKKHVNRARLVAITDDFMFFSGGGSRSECRGILTKK